MNIIERKLAEGFLKDLAKKVDPKEIALAVCGFFKDVVAKLQGDANHNGKKDIDDAHVIIHRIEADFKDLFALFEAVEKG